MKEYIKLEDYFRRMEEMKFEATPDVVEAAKDLLSKVNQLLSEINPDFSIEISSGWRAEAYNRTIPAAAKFSKHITGQAVDIEDPHGDLYEMIEQGDNLLEKYGLTMEHRSATKGWVHLQSVPVRSGRRIFYP